MNSVATISSPRLRWGRIIGGAFLLELVLVIVLVPPLQILGPDRMIPFVYPAVLILSFGVAWWLLRKVSHNRVMHGALIGAVATAIYILLCLANPDGIRAVISMYGVFGFILANGLRIIGCALPGYVLWRKS
jgi:hypothetical protein